MRQAPTLDHINLPIVILLACGGTDGPRRVIWFPGQAEAAPNGAVPQKVEAQTRLAGANVPPCCRGRGLPRELVKFKIYLTDHAPP